MRTPRFLLYPPSTIFGDQIALGGEELHHMRLVLRLNVNDSVEVVNAATRTIYSASIESIESSQAVLKITSSRRDPALPRLDACLGLCKPSTADFLVEKLTELGVEQIGFFVAERTQGGKDRASEKTLSRWNRIAENTLKQCRLAYAPTLWLEKSLSELVLAMALSPNAVRVVPVTGNERTFTGETPPILRFLQRRQAADITSENTAPLLPGTPLQQISPHADSIFAAGSAFLIGPEGGITAAELELAESTLGFRPVTLGPSILRTETAALVTAGILRAALC